MKARKIRTMDREGNVVDVLGLKGERGANGQSGGGILAETDPTVFVWAKSHLPFTVAQLSAMASGAGFVVNPTNFADGKTYFRYHAGETSFTWTNPNPQRGAVTITVLAWSQYGDKTAANAFSALNIVYGDGTTGRLSLVNGQTVTMTTDAGKVLTEIRGNYDHEDWVLLDMSVLTIAADYPAPTGTVKSVNGNLPDEEGNVQIPIPVVDSTLTKSGQAADAAIVGQKLTEQSEAIDEQRTEIDSIKSMLDETEISVGAWIMATINEGTDYTRTDRITTESYLQFTSVSVKIVPLNGYMYSIHEYDENKIWLSQSADWITEETLLPVTSGHYYRFVLRRADNGTITVEEGSNLELYGTAEEVVVKSVNGILPDENGDVTVEVEKPTDEQIASAVNDWLDANPDATTTVQDGSITEAKLADRSVTNQKISEELLNQSRTANLINPKEHYLANHYNKNEATSDVYDLIRKVPVLPSTTYVISPILFDELKAYNNTTRLEVYCYDAEGTYMSNSGVYSGSKTFTTAENTAFASIQIIHRDNGLDGIMMFEGSNVNAFDWDTYLPYYAYSLNKNIPVSYEQVVGLDEHLDEKTAVFETKENIEKVDSRRFVEITSENLIDPETHYLPFKKLAYNGETMFDSAEHDLIYRVPVEPGYVYYLSPDFVQSYADQSCIAFQYANDGTFIKYNSISLSYCFFEASDTTYFVTIQIPHQENGLGEIMLVKAADPDNVHDGWSYMDWTYVPYHKYKLRDKNVIVPYKNVPWVVEHIKKSPMFIPSKVRISAHRGDMEYFPENTVLAFESAGKKGAWGIETDPRMTSDGVLVCLHDTTVDRTTDGTGAIAEMTYDEVSALNINYGDGLGNYTETGVRIPTFDDYLKVCKKYGCVPVVHIAGSDETYVTAIYNAVLEMGMIHSTIFVSWSYDDVKAIRILDAECCIGVASYGITSSLLNQMEFLGGAVGVHALNKNAITEEIIREAHSRGITVWSGTDVGTTAADLEYWYNLGVDNIVHSDLNVTITE